MRIYQSEDYQAMSRRAANILSAHVILKPDCVLGLSTGSTPIGAYQQLIEQHGGKNVGSISGKTSFILAGDNMGPSKLQKAEKLGIPLVSEDDFLKIIE